MAHCQLLQISGEVLTMYIPYFVDSTVSRMKMRCGHAEKSLEAGLGRCIADLKVDNERQDLFPII